MSVRVQVALNESERLEDFTVTDDDRGITDVAREMLRRAGWIG